MHLRSGVRLGPYEIVAPIGAGGMGEVYRASDTRLGRAVAIKILPAEFAQDAKLKVRFEREAKIISSLNHPHICTLHDVGRENELDYLVMEYCEGKTLAQRLESGPLPIDQVLDYGMQIADALEKAHRKGIIHRDLKPSNIMLTKSGVKLLDFGLARQQGAAGPASSSRTSTVDQPLSADSGMAGTLQYMAPETLTSGQVDARSDIYALGLILYEMIGGRPAFEADSRAKLVASILERSPAPLQRSLDPQLEHIVSRCLNKDPEQRWQSAVDVAAELQWLRTRAGVDIRPKRRPVLAVWLTAAAALGLLAGAIFLFQRLQQRPVKAERRLSSLFIEEAPLTMGEGCSFAVSPDGKTFAYLAGWKLFFRSFTESSAKELSGTETAIAPVFSPDGAWIAFSQEGKLKKIDVRTGDVRPIADDGTLGKNFVRTTWGGDTIVFEVAGRLYQVSSSGSPVTQLLKGEKRFCCKPSFLPGGRQLLFDTAERLRTDPNERTIALLDLGTNRVSLLLKGGSQPQYSPTGHLLFVRADRPSGQRGTIYSVGFDLKSNRVIGTPVPRVRDVEIAPSLIGGGRAHYAVGPDGAIYYVPHDPATQQSRLVFLDRSGREHPATERIAPFAGATFSNDGTRLAYHDFGSIWVGDLARDTWAEVAKADYTQTPVWSPDGQSIAYEAVNGGKWGIWIAAADGSRPPVPLLQPGARVRPFSWSPDGRWIAFDKFGVPTAEGMWIVEVKTGKATQIAPAPATVPKFSPDGEWLAFVYATSGGGYSIEVQPFPGPGPRTIVYTGVMCPPAVSCTAPIWSPDGQRIFFRSGRKFLAAEVTSTNGHFRTAPAKILFETDLGIGSISADGQKFLAARAIRQPRWDHINVLSGWWID